MFRPQPSKVNSRRMIVSTSLARRGLDCHAFEPSRREDCVQMREEKRRRARWDAANPAERGKERLTASAPPTNPVGKGNNRCSLGVHPANPGYCVLGGASPFLCAERNRRCILVVGGARRILSSLWRSLFLPISISARRLSAGRSLSSASGSSFTGPRGYAPPAPCADAGSNRASHRGDERSRATCLPLLLMTGLF